MKNKTTIATMRPTKLKQFLGADQKRSFAYLSKELESGTPPHLVFFHSIYSGVGKTSLSLWWIRQLLEKYNDESPENVLDSLAVSKIVCTEDSGKRQILDKIKEDYYQPSLGNKISIIYLEELQGLDKRAQGALLSLFEPDLMPATTFVVAASTEYNSISKALRDRLNPIKLSAPRAEEYFWLLRILNSRNKTSVDLSLAQVELLIQHPDVNYSVRKFEEIYDGLAKSSLTIDGYLRTPERLENIWSALAQQNAAELIRITNGDNPVMTSRIICSYYKNNLTKRKVSDKMVEVSLAGLAFFSTYRYSDLLGEENSTATMIAGLMSHLETLKTKKSDENWKQTVLGYLKDI